MEVGGVGLEGSGSDGDADGGEEVGEGVVVVELQEGPREHFTGGEEVVDVGGVVPSAGVAGAGV